MIRFVYSRRVAPTVIGAVLLLTAMMALAPQQAFANPVAHRLNYAAASNGTISGAASQTVDYGDGGTAAIAVPDPGYHFICWSDGGTNATRIDTGVEVDVTYTATFAAYVWLADARLRATVARELRRSGTISAGSDGTTITPANMQALVSLTDEGDGITDLTGLQYATGLTSLDLQRNNITDLTPLSGLTALQRLSLDGNKVSDLAPLAGLTGLQGLSLAQNNVAGVSRLADLVRLQDLDLDDNRIADLSGLSGLTGLQQLSMDGNRITDLSPLRALKDLQSLSLNGNNNITDLSPLAGMTGVWALFLGNNNITDLSPLAGLTSVQLLFLDGNIVTDLSPLRGLTGLQTLYLDDNLITDLSPLRGLTGLQELYLDYNGIANLTPLSGLPSLQGLSLADNHVSDLSPLSLAAHQKEGHGYGLGTPGACSACHHGVGSDASSLKTLDLDNNDITDLSPLVGLAGLQELSFTDNKITDITPLNGLAALAHLDVTFNHLDLATGSSAMSTIGALQNAGAYVWYTPQSINTVTFSGNGGLPTTGCVTASFGASLGASMPVGPTRAGYAFVGWNSKADGSGSAFTSATVVTGNLTAHAQWSPNINTVTFSANGSPVAGSVAASFGASLGARMPVDPARAGYAFAGWNSEADGSGSAFTSATVIAGDVTLYAQWAAVCTLRYAAGPGGSIVGSSTQSVAQGSSGTTVTARPASGYHFAGWSDLCLAAARADQAAADVTYSARFAANLVPTTVTIISNHTAATHGHPVTLSGTISSTQPKNTHVAVYMRKSGSSTWVRIFTCHTTSVHRWSHAYSPTRKGTWYFQARFAGTTKYAASTSPSKKVTVK